MAQQFTTPQLKIRTALVVFMKTAPQPIVLYFNNPQKEYEDFKTAMKTPNSVIEKEANGPIKKICMISNNILGVFLQDEQYS